MGSGGGVGCLGDGGAGRVEMCVCVCVRERERERERERKKLCGQHHGQRTEDHPGDQRHASGNQKAGAGEHGPEEESWSLQTSPKKCNSSHHDSTMQR